MTDATIEQLLQAAQEQWRAGRPADAQPLLARLLAQQPDHIEALHLLGLSCAQLGRTAEAEAALRSVLRLRPDHASAATNLGAVLARAGRLNEAVEFLARGAALRPSDAVALLNLANAYSTLERFDDAISAYRRCIALDSAIPEVHRNLGLALKAAGQFDQAIECFNQVLTMNPAHIDAMNDLGTTLRDQGRLDDAEAAYRVAIAAKPDFGSSHWNLALLLLLRGKFEEGWVEYEWRRTVKESGLQRLGEHHPSLTQPRWDGSAAAGKRLYIYSEQGFGDTIQFIRYLPMVRATGAKIILACQTALVPLLKNLDSIEQCLPLKDSPPPFDTHCPLMSLPLIFKTTLSNIPADVPYLSADGAEWRDRLPSDDRRKIGLAWAGRRIPDPRRSIPSYRLTPLADVANIHWISLQKDAADGPPPGMQISDWTKELTDFSETAGLIANLDLVITIDTVVAHLAGAMGKPVWVLLPHAPNWRWMLNRADSPWYPTMRLFRQESPGDWQRPVRQIVQELNLS
jgi:Flp pilus assembly protein TadD